MEKTDDLMRRGFERIYPYVVALLGVVLFWDFHVAFPTGKDILSASITIGAVFTGFLATLKSIVISLQGPRIDKLRQTRFFDLLLAYLQEAIWCSLTYCTLCLIGFFYDAAHPPYWFGITWVFLAVATILTFQRVSSVLISLIRTIP